ncbi:MAG TPA: transporter, partial [Mycobacterium sp.]
YSEGILLERVRAKPIWIPRESITAIRMERGMAGKVVARIGILAIRWRLPSGTEIDTGFRADHREDYDGWLEEAARG